MLLDDFIPSFVQDLIYYREEFGIDPNFGIFFVFSTVFVELQE
jgi:hypothetical protein